MLQYHGVYNNQDFIIKIHGDTQGLFDNPQYLLYYPMEPKIYMIQMVVLIYVVNNLIAK